MIPKLCQRRLLSDQELVAKGGNEIAATAERLEALMTAVVTLRLSPTCYDFLWELVQMTPYQRLQYNMDQAMSMMYTESPVGLSSLERRMLTEIDASGASTEVRRTAHSLLDLAIRQQFKLKFGGVFKDRWERAGHRLKSRPLDSTVKLKEK